MTQVEITNKVKEIKELEQLIREAQAEAESLKDEIKAQMTRDGNEEITAGVFTIRYKDVTSSRFDGKRLKAEAPELYAQYCRETTTKRFTIN